ncbi:DHH family phosphoesterase [Helicobacter ailurogastricus]|uniref:3'-to-5' oligoribonuclease B, Bacillus type n=1 Tax=Helicobacter ailurogastricus TaxID=1578720 RepID=A0A0K2Y4F8_9HELI|nr:phosphoesterase [Helicobacter ailurogastricus]BDQ28204.1 3',5'-cyclic-nucleotide phosphodiesterase [Helicobacter ailurogastricus]CRF52744.1 3'-to-5' oligoribonuclease B, Bacillus type [Helicobacter ailurogastricus]
MQVFHLSHIDLDGYGCQFISRHFFKDIKFYNANYGREVSARLHEILDDISKALEPKRKILILVTDLNLTLNEAQFLQEQSDALRLQGLEVQVSLLDHHATGQDAAKIYHWYHLDTERSASKITFETLQKLHQPLESLESLAPMVEMINSIDIWQEGGFGFEFGKVCMRMIASTHELNRFMFDEEHRAYKFALLKKVPDYLHQERGEVAFDNDLFRLKKIALGGNPDLETMDNIASNAQVALLSKKKEECSIECEGKRGFLSYSMGGISVLANLFLEQNPEFDFYMDVSPKGSVSLRSNGKCDVSSLSKQYFNGGGHKNASGGKIEGFKESFSYYDIREQLEKVFHKEKGADYGFFGNRFGF